jgi:hypothetical protein
LIFSEIIPWAPSAFRHISRPARGGCEKVTSNENFNEVGAVQVHEVEIRQGTQAVGVVESKPNRRLGTFIGNTTVLGSQRMAAAPSNIDSGILLSASD